MPLLFAYGINRFSYDVAHFICYQHQNMFHDLTSFICMSSVFSGKQRRLTLIECNNDINSMIDIAKIADLVSTGLVSIFSLFEMSICIKIRIYFSERSY